ncbi:MAG TPA: hypothetical protein VG839_02540 [Asticcacaulis sp.]|nr:hypothetical protein [Asticcacaulis sp.]
MKSEQKMKAYAEVYPPVRQNTVRHDGAAEVETRGAVTWRLAHQP